MMIDTNQPLNATLNLSLKLDTSKASKASPVRPNTTYRALFYAHGRSGRLGRRILPRISGPFCHGSQTEIELIALSETNTHTCLCANQS
jgi:hypothetical protein